MQCKDCLQEISEKEYFNKSDEGICKKCRNRKAQLKYYNKKFGKNNEYVPLRLVDKKNDKKKNNKKKNNVIKSTLVNKKEIKKEKKIDNSNSSLYDVEIEEEVDKDIKMVFDKNGININKNEMIPFGMFLDVFIQLLDCKNGFMENYLKAEDLFNMLEGDYQHSFENASDSEDMIKKAKKFRCLLDKRRAVKNINAQYKQISNLLNEIKSRIPDIITKANQSKENLDNVIEKLNNHCYKVKASESVKKENFCIGVDKNINADTYFDKNDKNSNLNIINDTISNNNTSSVTTDITTIKYLVSVSLFNYYGNHGAFPFKRSVSAKSENEAIMLIKKFLSDKMPNCTYKENDFIVSELINQ